MTPTRRLGGWLRLSDGLEGSGLVPGPDWTLSEGLVVGVWVAESVAAYEVDDSLERPWRDEDVAMSGPELFGRFGSDFEARVKLAGELVGCIEYASRYGEGGLFAGAAGAVLLGSPSVRVKGRVYRVREVSA